MKIVMAVVLSVLWYGILSADTVEKNFRDEGGYLIYQVERAALPVMERIERFYLIKSSGDSEHSEIYLREVGYYEASLRSDEGGNFISLKAARSHLIAMLSVAEKGQIAQLLEKRHGD